MNQIGSITKTMLADELATPIESSGRNVIRASVDGFHNPPEIRYRKGADSPEGYYRDSINHQAIVNELLIPLGPGGNRQFRRAVYGYRIEEPVHEPLQKAPTETVLLFDGIFLLRPEFVEYWDFSIFINVDFEASVSRVIDRDLSFPGRHMDAESLRLRYHQRYIPGQLIYLREAKPKEHASVILDNNDLETPIVKLK